MVGSSKTSKYFYRETGTQKKFYVLVSLFLHVLLIGSLSAASYFSDKEETELKIVMISLAAPSAIPAQQKIEKKVEQESVKKEEVVEKESGTEKQINEEVKQNKKIAEKIEKAVEKKSEQQQPQQAAVSTPTSNDNGKDVSTAMSNITDAQYRRQSPPQYPPRALDLGQQGVVILHVLISPEGQAQELKVAKSSGYRLLDEAAISAAKRWEFEPARREERIVTSWVRVPVEFVIN